MQNVMYLVVIGASVGLVALGCSNDDPSSTGDAGPQAVADASQADADMSDAATGTPNEDAGPNDSAIADASELSDAGDSSAFDDFNGMCAQARWSNVSPECWSCWCSACESSLNAATRRSLEIFECMLDGELLVDDFTELACEIRAGQQDCVNGDDADWDKLVAFDTCLITMPTATEFRVCDTVCEVPYPGDVCARYP